MILANFLNKIFKVGGFVLEDANGKKHSIGDVPSTEKPLTVKLLKKKLHFQLLLYPQWYFPLNYELGNIEIKNGSITEVVDLFYRNIEKGNLRGVSHFIDKLFSFWSRLTKVATINRAKKQIQRHYDVNSRRDGNELYKLFLCSNLVYSCGVWKVGDDLEKAQERKIKLVLDKLNIKEGEKICEIGSGWGFGILSAARLTKAECLGITLSQNQLDYARKKAKDLNLDNQVKFELMDWRNLKGKFDAVFSIGAAEHFQMKKNGLKFFKKLDSILREKTGRALIHSIYSSVPNELRTKSRYIQEKIFPGGEIVDLETLISPISKANLELIDAQILRLDYVKTLNAWLSNLRKNKYEIVKKFGANLYRCYEIYLTGSMSSFQPYSDQNVVQLLIAKQKDALPPINFSYH